jgi:hypothetical protein
MLIIIYYIAILLMMNVVTVSIGFAVENLWGSGVSLVVFLTLYFLALWIAWVIAVWLTKPKIVGLRS